MTPRHTPGAHRAARQRGRAQILSALLAIALGASLAFIAFHGLSGGFRP